MLFPGQAKMFFHFFLWLSGHRCTIHLEECVEMGRGFHINSMKNIEKYIKIRLMQMWCSIAGIPVQGHAAELLGNSGCRENAETSILGVALNTSLSQKNSYKHLQTMLLFHQNVIFVYDDQLWGWRKQSKFSVGVPSNSAWTDPKSVSLRRSTVSPSCFSAAHGGCPQIVSVFPKKKGTIF